MVDQKKYHFIGIGGVGMSPIAYYLLALGRTVTGADIKDSPVVNDLKLKVATSNASKTK